ncbi:MAG: hypothetical protein MJ224_01335 [archaeon]|nr:hypothetical protein [archaeon]
MGTLFCIIGCILAFISFWGILAFEHWLVIKDTKEEYIKINIDSVTIIGCIFTTILSWIGLGLAIILGIIILLSYLLDKITKKGICFKIKRIWLK